jgi:hypothetical protein
MCRFPFLAAAIYRHKLKAQHPNFGRCIDMPAVADPHRPGGRGKAQPARFEPAK